MTLAQSHKSTTVRAQPGSASAACCIGHHRLRSGDQGKALVLRATAGELMLDAHSTTYTVYAAGRGRCSPAKSAEDL